MVPISRAVLIVGVASLVGGVASGRWGVYGRRTALENRLMRPNRSMKFSMGPIEVSRQPPSVVDAGGLYAVFDEDDVNREDRCCV